MPVALTASPQVLRDAYRLLYRAALNAVQYSAPARYVVRGILRQAFRDDWAVVSPDSSSSSSINRDRVSTSASSSSSSPPPLSTSSSPSHSSKFDAPNPSTNMDIRFPTFPSPSLPGVTLRSRRTDLDERYRPRPDFDRARVQRTLLFLEDAAARRGLAHRIVKSLVHTRYRDQQLRRERWRSSSKGGSAGRSRTGGSGRAAAGGGGPTAVPYDGAVAQSARAMFEDLLHELNQSMGLCLR